MSRSRVSTESPFLLVRTSRIHRQGVFARRAIRKGTRIIEYTGEKISRREGLRRDKAQQRKGLFYVFAIDKKRCVDGATGGDARLINHRCEPNCEYRRMSGKIWIYSLRAIKKGEELTYDYDIAGGKHPCNCRAKTCKGVI
jgi:SET domain-containing protein